MVRIRQILPGQPAAEISAEAWINSPPLRMADLRGRWVLIDFWKVGCAPCDAALPGLVALAAEFAPRLVLVGLCRNDPEDVARHAREHAMTHPLGAASLTGKAYGVVELPWGVLIDHEGTVRWAGEPRELAPVREALAQPGSGR